VGVRGVRADAAFCEEGLLSFLEERELPYVIVARLARWLKAEAARIEAWRKLEPDYAVGEFRLKLWG